MQRVLQNTLLKVFCCFRGGAVVVMASFLLLTSAGAAVAATVTQGYISKLAIPAGSVVSLAKDSQTTVEVASLANDNPIVGVASTVTQGVVSVSPNGSNLQVTTAGPSKILVSDINGAINVGDSLTLSPIDGVAMKATTTGDLVGIARDSSEHLENQTSRQLTDNSGANHSYKIGLLSADVQLGQYQPSGTQSSSNVVTGLQALSSNLSGKKLTPIRAIAAFSVVVLATIAAMVVLFSAVTSSIRSIGRNPLAKHAVLRSLGQVIFAVVIIIFAAFAGVYVIIGV